MKIRKTGRIIVILLLLMVIAGALVVLIRSTSQYIRRWFDSDSNPVLSSSDVSVSDAVVKPVDVVLNETSIEIGKGLKFQLLAQGGEGIVFRSSDEAIASVDESGFIKGTGVGQCTVTAENKDGRSANCAVTVKKTCYLTIDDGPTKSTEDILAVLKEYDVKATFFVVSSYQLNLTKDMQEQGHVVGLHSNSHKFRECYATYYSYFRGIELLSERVEEITGKKCDLLRFPGGTDNTRCNPLWMRRNLSGAEDLGYRVFDWTATAGDTSKKASAAFSLENVKKTCTDDEEILLMHDRSLNVPALKKIIPYLREQGYIFSTLDHYPEKSYHTMPIYSRDHADLPSKSVSITHATYSIYAGGEILLVAKMVPNDSTDFVRWESADPSIATVNISGNVKALKKGKVDIYAITSSGQRGVCHMTVLG